jgi:regulator of sigma E protease
MLSVIGFVLVLIPLVVVHELGHFLFAKLFNVRADAFSIGFGPVLFQKKMGETDFRVSAIPLGGYVKLLGEDPTSPLSEEEKKRALHNQAPWKRFFIFFGGPFFNFIWAVIVFMIMMAVGEPQVATTIGRVLPNTAAEQAGFKSGDTIKAVLGTPVTKFEEVMTILSDQPNREVSVQVDRAGKSVDLKVMTTAEEGFSIYGEAKEVGSIDGIVANARMTKIGISNPKSLAAVAGMKTGDEIISINSIPVQTFEELEAKYSEIAVAEMKSKKPTEVKFEVRSDAQTKTVVINAKVSGNIEKDFGFYSSELFVEQAMKDTPAEKAGFKKGDRIVSVNQVPVFSFFGLRQAIQKAGETEGKVTVAAERDGQLISVEVVPQVSSERDPVMKKRIQYTVGLMPVASLMEAKMIVERIYNPFKLLYRGTERMIEMSARNLISIGKMFLGQVSVKSLGGPILIGKLAGDSISRGLIDFLRMMAILSIGLGILNILPIPVLDGGHIVLLGVEVLKGKPLNPAHVEKAQQFGLVVILLIMVIVMKNDISRLPIFN